LPTSFATGARDTRQKKKTADKQAGGHDYERSRLSKSIAKR